MTEIAEFFAMGGYAKYVWASYGAALVVLVLNFLEPMISTKRLRARLARIIQLKRGRT